MKYISDNEIACCSLEDAVEIIKVLFRNNYVCMLSQEEGLTIINYEWDEYCDRNGVIFRSREDWEWEEEIENRTNVDIECAYSNYTLGKISEKEFIDTIVSIQEDDDKTIGDCVND